MNVTATIAPADGAVGQAGGPQYMRALQRANQVRVARAELKRRVAYGDIEVAEVILHCPWEAHGMAVADLLMSQRHWGTTRSRKIMALLPLSAHKTVGSLTHRQRGALAAVLIPPPSGRGDPTPSGAGVSGAAPSAVEHPG
jgi:hypothetical protein